MCVLPNFEASNLLEFKRERKAGTTEAQGKTVEMVNIERQLLKRLDAA